MCTGGEYGPAKRWPEERFIEAAITLHRRTGCRWLLFGTRGEAEVCERIVGAITRESEACAWSLAGQTSLKELAALLGGCSLVLGNDSGPLHLAAACGAPVAVLFGSTSAEFTQPGLPGDPRNVVLTANAPCAPCFLRECPIDMRCMRSLTVEHITEAVLTLHDSSPLAAERSA